MIERTSTEHARRVPVEANDKRFARMKVLKGIVKRIERGLGERKK